MIDSMIINQVQDFLNLLKREEKNKRRKNKISKNQAEQALLTYRSMDSIMGETTKRRKAAQDILKQWFIQQDIDKVILQVDDDIAVMTIKKGSSRNTNYDLLKESVDEDTYNNIVSMSESEQFVIKTSSEDIKQILFTEQNGLCNGCGEAILFKNMEIDHIVSKKKGGKDRDDNFQLLCGHCNRVKSDNDMEFLKKKIMEESF